MLVFTVAKLLIGKRSIFSKQLGITVLVNRLGLFLISSHSWKLLKVRSVHSNNKSLIVSRCFPILMRPCSRWWRSAADLFKHFYGVENNKLFITLFEGAKLKYWIYFGVRTCEFFLCLGIIVFLLYTVSRFFVVGVVLSLCHSVVRFTGAQCTED